MSGEARGTINPVDPTSIPPVGHGEAVTLAATEFQRDIDVLRQLDPDDWMRQTECELWDVRAMAGHMLGMAEAQASVRQFLHDFRAGNSRQSGTWLDAVTATQVRERAHLTAVELVDRFAHVAPRAVHTRKTFPWPLRWAVRPKQEGVFEGERWALGHVLDVILTRDRWMHRLDISRAIGRPMVLSSEHDGRLVADVVAEWGRRHGRPFSLTLGGAAGGRWRSGTGGQQLELDALDFCRIMSGRDTAQGLLATPVPF
jgi:uncharacterized protein (TIGR03083 family)